MEELKYRLTDECLNFGNRKLFRIEALKDFGDVKKGDKGGFVESENNLSHKDDCWVYDYAFVYNDALIWGDAKVYNFAVVFGNAVVCGHAKIFNVARVFGNALVRDYAKIYGHAVVCNDVIVHDYARIFNNAQVFGKARICGDAKIVDYRDYIVFKNWWSSGRYFTWTRSNNMWSVGCFYGTGKELIKKAYEDSELSGREYERVVDYVESILRATTDEEESTSL